MNHTRRKPLEPPHNPPRRTLSEPSRSLPRMVLSAAMILLAMNLRMICTRAAYTQTGALPLHLPAGWTAAEIAAFLLVFWINLFPTFDVRPVSTARNKILADGVSLLQLFLATVTAEAVYCIGLAVWPPTLPDGVSSRDFFFSMGYVFVWARYLAIAFLVEFVLFWNGILRVYFTSVQLGIRWRVAGILCGMIPIVHLYVLCRIISICHNEWLYENEKYILDHIRAENEVCRTRYPLLLVHGVFFRDFRFFNYWGRIPTELIRNGARIYYGSQQSAASVARCGEELAARIRQIVQETGCGKVNIIAHSKGGLDSRYAISRCGAADCVASLTTVNTPHRGCLFADYLLTKIPDRICRGVAAKYNGALKHFGDPEPDFMEAVRDLTASACVRRNPEIPDNPQVFYQSVGSKMNRASSGRFPLNMVYPMVKHFDGDNDGLVSVESMKWGADFTCRTVPSGRGISHGDMIDLNRENIPGFDVREFYVDLVHNLKEMGF